MRLQRLLMIVFYLKMHNSATITELSKYLEVSKRTISRDVEMLRTAGVEIESRIGTAGGYFLKEDFSFESILFSKSELQSMLLGTQFLFQFKDTEFAKEAEVLYDKVSKILERDIESSSQSKKFVLIDTESSLGIDCDINMTLKHIENAYDRHKLLFVDYKSMLCSKFSTSGFVAPYGLINKRGDWYLVGYCFEHKAYRIFNIVFIQKINITQDSFVIDKSFNLDSFWESQKRKG